MGCFQEKKVNRFDPAPHIENSNKITDIFGYWPHFHDAEIKEVRLEIADGKPWSQESESPVMEMVVHLFQMTKDVSPTGHFILTKHTLARLRFRNIEGLQLYDFSHQNCIFDLEFALETAGQPHVGKILFVRIGSSVGLAGEFRCKSAEVVSAAPCDGHGNSISTIP